MPDKFKVGDEVMVEPNYWNLSGVKGIISDVDCQGGWYEVYLPTMTYLNKKSNRFPELNKDWPYPLNQLSYWWFELNGIKLVKASGGKPASKFNAKYKVGVYL